MDKFEITLEELEQICTELGLELIKHCGHSFTNVYVKLPESEIWNKNVIDARGVISCTFIDTSVPITIESTDEYNTVFELFFTFRGDYRSGYSLVSNGNNPYYGLRNAADVRFNDKDKDWKTLLDDKIVHLRKLDRDLNNAFEEAIAYYKILNKDSDDYYFAFNFYQGKIHYVQLVPGLLQEFLAYEKLVNNIDDETYKKYEEDCLNNFKKETKEYNTKADAFSPVATIPTYKTWVEDKKAEEPIEDTALNIANEQCKEILDKINQ